MRDHERTKTTALERWRKLAVKALTDGTPVARSVLRCRWMKSAAFDFDRANHLPPGEPNIAVTRSHFAALPARNVSAAVDPQGQRGFWR